MPASLGELSQVSGARLFGDADCIISSINTLSLAKNGEITFLSNRHYAHLLSKTAASAVILTEEDSKNCPTNSLVCKDPYLAYAKIVNYLYPKCKQQGFIHESAVIARNVLSMKQFLFLQMLLLVTMSP